MAEQDKSFSARDALKSKARSKPKTVHYAAEVGDIPAVKELVKEGMIKGNPESVTLQAREDVLNMMPIHIASETGHLEVVEFLIAKRVDLDAGDMFRVTAMHLAAIENHPDIIEALLKARANVNPVDEEGDLPIHWAATKGHSEVLKLLVRKGSPVDVKNKKGWTPLHRAAYNGRCEAVHTLIKLGASMGTTTQEGNTALHLACYMNQLSTVAKLCEFAAPQRLRNVHGKSALDLCLTDGAREILTSLGGFGGDEPTTFTPAAPAAAKALAADSLQPLNIHPPLPAKGRVIEHEDGFPSPGHSPPASFTQQAAPQLDSAFLRNAFNDAGTNPYASTQGMGPPQTHEVNTNTTIGTSSSSTAAGLAASPMPLAGALRPLRTPNLGSTSSGTGAGGNVGLLVASAAIDNRAGGNTPAAAVLSLGTSAAHGSSQERIKEENRRALAVEGVLTPRASRPVSANKKFLSKYNLEKLNLFAP